MQQITIIGAGAIGLLYGARLSGAGCRIEMVTRTMEQAELIRRQGIIYTDRNGKATACPAEASCYSAWEPGGNGWMLLAVKQHHIGEDLAGVLARAAAQRPLLCLQNGIGHMELLRSRMPEAALCAGVTTEGALRTASNAVRHTGAGRLAIEQLGSSMEHSQNLLVNIMKKAGIDAFLSNEVLTLVSQKLLINAVINPLTALLGVRNGDIVAQPHPKKLAEALFVETQAILEQAGYPVQPEDWERVKDVCKLTAGNQSSMLADVQAGRKTEIAWINGAVVALADRYGIPSPLNKAVIALITGLAGDYEGSRSG